MRRHCFALALGLAAAVPFAAHAGHRDIAVSIAVPGLSVSYGPGWGVAVAPPVYAPAPVYYGPVVRPAPVYYYGRPVVYAPPVRYVAPRPVVVVPRYGHPGWRGHPGHGHHHGHGERHAGHWR